ncbi:uncharacterized protein LOC131675440 [Phymastichus coffea]|uniref:uncharacterized protein LOC131675440 n=1 Tax=Phymastichus coffea TaxID=108790 RepID=UPI00273B9E12|nr:uncharacterized protein LOC131675440 [Phymastichus coffea]
MESERESGMKKKIKLKVVKFVKSSEITTVPENWLKEQDEDAEESEQIVKCSWPNKKSKYEIQAMIEKRSASKNSWPTYCVEILGTADTLLEAKAKEKIASSDENCTDIDAKYDRLMKEAQERLTLKSKRNRKRKKHDDYVYDAEVDSSDSESDESSDRTGENDGSNVPEETPPRVPQDQIFKPQASFATNNESMEDGDSMNEDDLLHKKKDEFDNIQDNAVGDGTIALEEENMDEITNVLAETQDSPKGPLETLENEEAFHTSQAPSGQQKSTSNEDLSKSESTTEGKPWNIVQLLKWRDLTVVPSIWVSKDKTTTRWPPDESKNLVRNYIVQRVKPCDDWRTISIKQFIDSAETYALACEFIDKKEKDLEKDKNSLRISSDIHMANSTVKEDFSPKDFLNIDENDLNAMNSDEMFKCTLRKFYVPILYILITIDEVWCPRGLS